MEDQLEAIFQLSVVKYVSISHFAREWGWFVFCVINQIDFKIQPHWWCLSSQALLLLLIVGVSDLNKLLMLLNLIAQTSNHAACWGCVDTFLSRQAYDLHLENYKMDKILAIFCIAFHLISISIFFHLNIFFFLFFVINYVH